MVKRGIALLMLLAVAGALQAEVRSWVARNPVVAGEAFHFMVESENGDDGAEPDLSGLQEFEVVSRSVQNSTTIVNTQVTHSMRWTFTLVPRAAGEFTIPAIPVGSEQTQPFVLKVVNPGSQQSGQPAAVDVKAKLSRKSVYPGQELVYTVRIVRWVDAEEESLAPVEPFADQVERTDPQTRIEMVNGRKAKVTTLHYLIYPKQAGTLKLPSLRYQGNVLVGNSRGSFQNLRMFNRNTRRLYRQTPERTVTVKPLPAGQTGWWLPARKVQLVRIWKPNPPQFQVGEPTTMELVITAEGVLPSQLPTLELAAPDGLRAYPGTPASSKTLTQSGFRSEWKQSWALIPVRAGRFVLPELRLRWWDTQHERFREAVVPEQVIEAIPSAAPQSQAARMTSESEPAIGHRPSATSDPPPTADPFWKWLALGSLGLWSLTLVGWAWSRQRRETPEKSGTEAATANLRQTSKQLLAACKANDGEKARSALLAWEQLRHPQEQLRNLDDVVRLDPALKESVDELLQSCYGTLPQAWEGTTLLGTVEQLAKKPNSKSSTPEKPVLEPMVP